ncbi:hypothetical protein GWK47_029392 [Chionoecetes opilio]|uniref:Uncharacterized protein n=1 Tax=Chionoecetes opilio TaxID=41210 RepID=A0A8J4YMG2_CHIOP|nr:hypothetical protein GWK47_029392 [Chionoecetes opilio]
MVPSHEGSEVTRAPADPGRQGAASGPPLTCSASQPTELKAQANGPQHTASPDTRELEARKGRRPPVRCSPRLPPPGATRNNPGRWRLRRVRLGYCTEGRRGFRGKCATTRDAHPSPTGHYPLSCPAPAHLRPARPRRPPQGGAVSGREGRGAPMVRHTPRDVMLGGVLRASAPSPLGTSRTHTPPRPAG